MTSLPPHQLQNCVGGNADAFRKLRFQFLNKNQPPAGTMLPFEGLPSADASMGIDVVAALNR